MSETDLSKSNRLEPEELEGEDRRHEEEESLLLAGDGEIEPVGGILQQDEELMILSPVSDEFDEKVAEAQEQLLHLRHQQEQLEKQKAELEELKRKREKFLRGRAEATDRLTKATTMLEREMFEAKKRLEQFGHAREAFERHLEVLEKINPEEWERDEMRNELARALAAIQDAREEYTTEMARVGAVADVTATEAPAAPLPVEVAAEEVAENSNPVAAAVKAAEQVTAAASNAEVRDFVYWLRSGFAFTLPLLIFGIFALVLVLIIF